MMLSHAECAILDEIAAGPPHGVRVHASKYRVRLRHYGLIEGRSPGAVFGPFVSKGHNYFWRLTAKGKHAQKGETP